MWSTDGTRYAFAWTKRTGVETDIYVEDPLDRRLPEMVYEAKETGWDVADWSPDGKSLLLVRFVSINESYLHVYDLESRTLTEIEPSKQKAARFGGLFSRDGKGVYFTSDLGSEFRTLRYAELTNGKITALSGHVNWDVDDLDAVARRAPSGVCHQ